MTELSPERRDLVLSLLDLSVDRPHVMAALSEYPWDSDADVEFEPWKLRLTLEKTVAGEHSVEALAQWAEDIEVRDDVQMTDVRVREIIHVLASPDLEGATDAARLRDWIGELGTDEHQ